MTIVVNGALLRTLNTNFSALFQRGFAGVRQMRDIVATPVPSTTKSNEYGWLGDVPGMREWLGDRVINELAANGYTIKNRKWEQTIGVQRDDIEDDNVGVYAPRFQLMGNAAAKHPEQMVFAQLKAGFATNCYDGQFYFDTDHTVLDENGAATSVANTDGGAGTPWFLMDSSFPVKPIIFQERKKLAFVAKDNPDDENVFMRDQYLYGADARYNVGYGFWQICWGSKQPLTPENYAIGRAALMNMKGDYGRPLGIVPDKLIVPGTLESNGRKICYGENTDLGATNEWKGTAELEVVPWLA